MTVTRKLPLLVVLVTACLLRAEGPQGGTVAKRAGGNPADWQSPDTLASAVYRVVSGPAGQARDWDRYRALFRRNAKLITFGGANGALKVFEMSVDDYVKYYAPSFLERGVEEKELSHRTERYGHVAQRWGVCGYRWGDEPKAPMGRSVVTMHFIHDGTRWWITSMIWETEDKANPIPQFRRPDVNDGEK